jgi:hypothetical protein
MSPTKTIPLNRNLNQSNVTVILAATRTVQMADEMSQRTDLTRLDVIDLIRSIGEQLSLTPQIRQTVAALRTTNLISRIIIAVLLTRYAVQIVIADITDKTVALPAEFLAGTALQEDQTSQQLYRSSAQKTSSLTARLRSHRTSNAFNILYRLTAKTHCSQSCPWEW